MREAIAAEVADRLRNARTQLQSEFTTSRSVTRHAVLDDVLADDVARSIHLAFPADDEMRLRSSIRERKYTSKQVGELDQPLGAISFALQDLEVIREIEAITGIQGLEGDPLLYAGGVSGMREGHFLSPHIDNSHDHERRLYRRINLLYYVSPDWNDEHGGELELWDAKVRSAVAIPARFNRLVVMETTRTSFHSVRRISGTSDRRLAVSSYLFSPQSPNGTDYFHVTSYSAPPSQPFRRAILAGDGLLRSAIRKVKPSGFGRADLNLPKE